jgi:hypothetical protein
VWRSLVAHLLGVQVVAGSNPVTPTNFFLGPRKGTIFLPEHPPLDSGLGAGMMVTWESGINMSKPFYQIALENREKMDQVSGTFCLAKWLQVSIHLPTGRTHSCYHPPTHKIPLNLLDKQPDALHNTPLKAEERRLMKEGKRPPGCAYCWKVEDLGREHLSDRIYRSSEDWAWEKFEEIKGLPHDFPITPRYVEVNFNQACQFKCSYCSPQLSSAWMNEIKQYGFFPTSHGHNRMDWFEKNDLIPIGPTEPNLYVEAFWRWWPTLYPELRVFRMTGGEPLIDENTFKVLEYALQHPHPDLTLSITTNLNPPQKQFDRFIELVTQLQQKKSIKNFALFVSMDSIGAQAEYIRYGLNYENFTANLEKWMAIPGSSVSFIQTFCNLALPGFKKYLEWILELRKKYNDGEQKIFFDTPFLRSPGFLSLQILDEKTKSQLDPVISWAETLAQGNPDSVNSFSAMEVAKMKRVRDWMNSDGPAEIERLRADFYFYFTEYDLRRKVNFHKTFPELKDFWNLCRVSSEAFSRTYDSQNKFASELEALKNHKR